MITRESILRWIIVGLIIVGLILDIAYLVGPMVWKGNQDILIVEPRSIGVPLSLPNIGTKSVYRVMPDIDTMFVFDLKTGELIGYEVYFHIGGRPGDVPDSTAAYSGSPYREGL